MLCGVVAGESADTAEALIVKLLGGSKPNASAEVRREGGSVTEGTLGSLTGEAAHYSLRVRALAGTSIPTSRSLTDLAVVTHMIGG